MIRLAVYNQMAQKLAKEQRKKLAQLFLGIVSPHLLDEQLAIGAQELPELPRSLQLQLGQGAFALPVADAVDGPGSQPGFDSGQFCSETCILHRNPMKKKSRQRRIPRLKT